MIQRPKPSDSESDLLREQEEFLSSGGRPAANVARRPEKRRGDEADGDGGEPQENQRDVVTITDLPDDLPALTPASAPAPAPPKKSRFKKERVRFEDEDPEELLDKHDTHISAVLSRIVERDTSSVPVSFPTFTTTAFPKVLHRSTAETQVRSQHTAGRKSIFARQIAAQNAKEGRGNSKNDPKIIIPQRSGSTRDASGAAAAPGSLLVSGQGLGPDSAAETLRIHQENQARLENMSQSEIVDEQKKLLAQLDPRLVDFVRSRKSQKASSSGPSRLQSPDQLITKGKPAEETDSETEVAIYIYMFDVLYAEEDLPVRPQKEWVHMDKLEPEKLEWTRDLPAPRKQSTKQAMQARFDFSGSVIPPTQDLPTHLGLHHHGEEPELAGYSLQELFLLSRSQLTQQRTLALNTLAQILSKARAGVYCNTLKGSVLSSLLDAGLIFLLRFSLDDGVESVMSAAVHALRALLVSPDDEECLDRMFPWLMGMAAFPLLPSGQEEEEEDDEGLDESMKLTAKEKELRKTDHDVARVDVIKGLLKMQVLQRLRYILEVVRPAPGVVLDVLEVLIRIARHSASAATQILDCPRLMETVMSEFLPCSWAPPTSPAPPSLYGLPVSAAMKLLRVLASAGRHTCSRILNSLGGRERLSRFLAAEHQELLLEPGEAFLCSTEALRLWAVAASYGQACSLCSSVICRSVSDAPGPDLVSSLPGLGCVRLKMNPSLAGPGSPLALCSALFYLLDVLTSLHRGLTQRVGLISRCCVFSNSVRSSVFQTLLSTDVILSLSLFREGGGAGPEAASLSELDLQENSTPPSGLGPLLRLSLSHLPSIRGCYLTFLSHLEPAVLSSRDRHLGRTPWLTSQLLPELSGPSLPSDWPFLPLISLYERTGVCEGRGQQVGSVPAGALQAVVQCLQWLLLVESWRGRALSAVPPGAKLARLSCVFLCSTDLFLERPVQDLTWALFRRLTGPTCLQDLDLGTPPPGLASFHDLYSALLVQYEAVSFGDPLFGCFVLLPLQRRYSATMRLAVFGEHVGILRSLGVSLQQLPFPLENFTSPPEDSLPLLRLYFRALVTGALRRSWCPVLYVVAVAHLNAFIFSQEDRVCVLFHAVFSGKTHYLTDEVRVIYLF
uniref:RNA polymerase II associated protein 1 n=1 Tax=Astyanax mexicanus TaxID=7994 RepID=A0A8B9KI32_ASTMX